MVRELWREEKWSKDAPCELALSLDNFENDDKKPPTLEMAVVEAQYIIDLHYEGGTVSHEMLSGESGPEAVEEAQKTIKDCRAFIRKYGRKEKTGRGLKQCRP